MPKKKPAATINKSKESFLIAGRNLNALSLAASLCAGFVGGGFLVLFIGLAYIHGFSAMWLIAGQAAGLVLFAVFGKAVKNTADKKKLYTLSDYFRNQFDKKTALLSSILIFLFFMGFIVVQLIAGGEVLHGLTGWPYGIAVVIIALSILAYLFLGGFNAVVKTDFFQYLIILFFMIVIGFSLWSSTGQIAIENIFVPLPLATIIAFCIFGIFFVIIGPDVWQRAYAAKSLSTLRKGFSLAAVLVIVNGFLACLVGIAARSMFRNINPSEALVMGFTHMLPKGFLVLGLILLFCAIMSTADTLIFVAAMNIAHDILPNWKKSLKPKVVALTKAAIIAVTLVSLAVALTVTSIIDFAFIFTASTLVLAPIIIYSQRTKLKANAAFLALAITPPAIIIITLFTGIKEELSLFSLVISVLLLFIGQKVFK